MLTFENPPGFMPGSDEVTVQRSFDRPILTETQIGRSTSEENMRISNLNKKASWKDKILCCKRKNSDSSLEG